MRRWSFAVVLALLGSLACERGTSEVEPSPTSTTVAPARPRSPDTKALESAPASTDPLADSVAPPTAPVPGLEGLPAPSPAAGRLDAPVRVTMFTDYQCPVCRRALEPLKLLVRSHPTDVVLVVKQAPSPRHHFASEAAAATLAAFRQGQFWPYQDAMFVDQRRLGRAASIDLARAAGLDVDAFARALDDPAIATQIRYETALAQALDLAATPSFVVNGHVQRGWGSYRGLEAIVEREVARARTIAAGGVAPNRVAYEATRRTGPEGERLAAALFEPPTQ